MPKKPGRKPLAASAMTPAERQARYRNAQSSKAAQAATWREALEQISDGPTTLQEARAIASAALHSKIAINF